MASINRHKNREESEQIIMRNMATWTDTSDDEDLSPLIPHDQDIGRGY